MKRLLILLILVFTVGQAEAGTRITELGAMGAAPDAADVLEMTDVDDATMDATGTSKKVTTSNLFGAATDLDVGGALSTGCVADNEIDYANVTCADITTTDCGAIGTSGVTFTDADVSPNAVGELQYDNTVAGVDDGWFAWYDDDEIKYLLDINTLPTDAEDDYIPAYDKDTDKLYWKQDADSGGATLWNNIGNPTADDTIALAGYEVGFSSTLDEAAHVAFKIDHTDADVAAATTVLQIQSVDDGQANLTYIKIVDDSAVGANTVFSVGADGAITTDTALTVPNGGTGATTLTDGGILLGSAGGAVTVLGVAANGQIPIGDGATDPVLATITGTANEIDVTNGAGSITLSLPASITVDVTGALTGNASTATALAANGANAGAGNAILGVDASGAAEGSFDVWTEAENTAAGYTANTGDVEDVFDCASGDCATMTVGTGEWLVYGTGFIDANRFAGVTTVDGTEFGYVNGVTSAIQTQIDGKEASLTDKASLETTLSDVADVAEADGDVFTGVHDFGGATTWEIWNSTTDMVVGVQGQMGLQVTDDQLVFHGGAAGEIQGEAALSLLKHVSIAFDPAGYYDQETTYRALPIMTVGDDAPEGITITEWRMNYVGGDPTTEFAGDLICDTTPDYNRAAGATVMDILDTTAGASTADTGFDSATCANASKIYIDIDSDPTDANVMVIFEFWFYAEED